MADETIFKQDFSINHSITRSVTIYPTRAAIVRDIENVTIRPGTNIITLHNISSLVEEQSIKVDGHGMDGIVTEMVVDIVPNRAPPQTEGESDTEVDSESEDEEDLKSVELLAASLDARTGEMEVEKARTRLATYEAQLSYLEKHMEAITTKPAESTTIEGRTRDLRIFHDTSMTLKEMCQVSRIAIEDEEKKFAKAKKKEKRLQDAFDRERKAGRESQSLRRLARSDRRREREEARLKALDEVYRVRITVESQTLPKDTNTVDASTDRGRPKEKRDDDNQPTGPYLRVSYITNGASWTPQYDLRLDTVSCTGALTYRAIYHNRTGELWKNASITLSTSQNSFSGLDDKVPTLPPWHVTLQRHSGGTDGLYAPGERDLIQDTLEAIDPGVRERPPPAVLLEQQRTRLMQAPMYKSGKMMRKSMGMPHLPRLSVSASVSSEEHLKDSGLLYSGLPSDSESDSESTAILPSAKLRLATTAVASHGTTTTYALPGSRTLPSSSQARRHIISETPLSEITFTHIAVPKFRTAAFLNAKIPLPEGVSILPGPAGLTLDSSFLGHTALPRCSGGDSFPMSLGVDQAVKIRYPRPVKRSATASRNIVLKEKVVTYSRSVVVVNGRDSRVSLVVRDQVPVADKEALRIGAVEAKVPEGVKGSVKYGKRGEIVWELEFEGRKECTLPLEWEARMPSDMAVENVGGAY